MRREAPIAFCSLPYVHLNRTSHLAQVANGVGTELFRFDACRKASSPVIRFWRERESPSAHEDLRSNILTRDLVPKMSSFPMQ